LKRSQIWEIKGQIRKRKVNIKKGDTKKGIVRVKKGA
jgi:hypothetical protein